MYMRDDELGELFCRGVVCRCLCVIKKILSYTLLTHSRSLTSQMFCFEVGPRGTTQLSLKDEDE